MARIFISCGFESDTEKERADWAARVLRARGHDVVWLGGPGASSQSAMRQAPRAGEYDGMVAFVNDRGGGRPPPGVEQELVLAARDDLPIFAFLDEGVKLGGLLSAAVIPRGPLAAAMSPVGEARLLEFASNVAPSGLTVELVGREGEVEANPLLVLQKFRIVNKTSKAVSGVEIGLVCSSETSSDAVIRLAPDLGAPQELPALPRAHAEFYDVGAVPLVTVARLTKPLGPFSEVEFLAGYRGHANGWLSRYVHFGVWVLAEGKAPWRAAYAGGYNNYHEPSFDPVKGPPFELYEVTEGGPTMSLLARRRPKN